MYAIERERKLKKERVLKMAKAELKREMSVWGNAFYEKTCPKLQAEIIRKIINCKAIDDFAKITMINQYTKNLVTNDCVIEAIKMYNNR